MHGIDASREVKLASGLLVPSDCGSQKGTAMAGVRKLTADNGASRTEFRDQAGSNPAASVQQSH